MWTQQGKKSATTTVRTKLEEQNGQNRRAKNDCTNQVIEPVKANWNQNIINTLMLLHRTPKKKQTNEQPTNNNNKHEQQTSRRSQFNHCISYPSICYKLHFWIFYSFFFSRGVGRFFFFLSSCSYVQFARINSMCLSSFAFAMFDAILWPLYKQEDTKESIRGVGFVVALCFSLSVSLSVSFSVCYSLTVFLFGFAVFFQLFLFILFSVVFFLLRC